MNEHTEEISFFRSSLLDYLENYHPEQYGDRHFIDKRCEQAAQTFEQARLEGENVSSAVALACEVLFAGLRFSKYGMIVSILETDFDRIAPEKIRETALELLPVCENVFELYEITDEFEQSHEFKRCTYEVIGLINIYFQDHGL